MNEIDIYEKAYYYEIDRMDNINSRITIPLGVLSLITGVIGGLIPKYFILPNLEWVGYLKIISLIFVFIYIYSIYISIRSYYGYKYGHVPSWESIDKYKKDLYEYEVEDNRTYEEINQAVLEKTTNYYIDILKKTRDMNFELNEKKLRYQLKLGVCLSIQIPLIGIMYILLTYYKI